MDRWQRTAWIVWTAVVLAGIGRAALYHNPRHCGCYDIFAEGGRHWLAGEAVYDLDHPESLSVFRYSPLVAAGCAPLSLLSAPAGSAVLRFVNLAVLIAGLAVWGKRVLPLSTDRAKWLLLIALAGGPPLLDVQLTLLTLGLMLLATAAFTAGRPGLSALALSVATCLKAYPVALGLLFVVIEPRRFGWRFAAALLLALALPFAFQTPNYVAGQYRDWLIGGLNPRYIDGAFQDVMFTWQRWIGPMDRSTYTLLSVAAGAAVGGVIFVCRGQVSVADSSVSAFGLGTAWMMAFGPATEGTTYIVLAPAAAFMMMQGRRMPGWRRWAAIGAYAILAAGQLQLLFPLGRPIHRVGAQPAAAVLLLIAFATWKPAGQQKAADEPRQLGQLAA
jgi:hypothetical protein